MLKRLVLAQCSPEGRRCYKSMVPMIKWVKPEKLPSWHPQNSGDLEPVYKPERSMIALDFKDSALIENADESVKKIFSIGFQGKESVRDVVKEELKARVRRHETDENSPEIRIAGLTAHIRIMQDHLARIPKDGQARRICKELVDLRKQKLRNLRKIDYRRFEWLLEKLQLTYKSLPEEVFQVTRKSSLIKLTDRYCDEIKDKKLLDYKKQLELERENLLKYYEENPLPPSNYEHTFPHENDKNAQEETTK